MQALLSCVCCHQHGWTALMWASHYGRVEALEVLLDGGADANIQDKVRCALGGALR